MLRQTDKGKTILEACRENNISEQTFHRWKSEFGMIDVNQAKRMKELEKENARLKRMLADKMLGIEILLETLEKKWKMSLTLGSKPWAQAAERLVARGRCSMRAGCRYFRLHRCP